MSTIPAYTKTNSQKSIFSYLLPLSYPFLSPSFPSPPNQPLINHKIEPQITDSDEIETTTRWCVVQDGAERSPAAGIWLPWAGGAGRAKVGRRPQKLVGAACGREGAVQEGARAGARPEFGGQQPAALVGSRRQPEFGGQEPAGRAGDTLRGSVGVRRLEEGAAAVAGGAEEGHPWQRCARAIAVPRASTRARLGQDER